MAKKVLATLLRIKNSLESSYLTYLNLGMLMPYYDKHQAEEEMYKEIFRLFAMAGSYEGTTPIHIYDDQITWVRPHFAEGLHWKNNAVSKSNLISINFPNVTTLGTGSEGECFSRAGLVSVKLDKLTRINGSYNFAFNNAITEINLPELTNFTEHTFSYSSSLKILNLPSVTTKSGSFFVYQDSALEHVYLPKMTLALLGGASYIAQQLCNSAAIFHLQDGDYDYQGQPITT